MKSLSWLPGQSPVAPGRRVPVERFGKTSKTRTYTVWLLADVRCRYTHWPQHGRGSGSMPCLKPNVCPYCDDATAWHKRREGFAPALLQSKCGRRWDHIVAAFTSGAVGMMPAGPHAGLKLKVWREQHKDSFVKPLKVEEIIRMSPPAHPFDIEPWLLRMWFPHDEELPEAEAPEPIEAAIFRPEAPEPTQLPKELMPRLYRDLLERNKPGMADKIAAEYQERFNEPIPGMRAGAIITPAVEARPVTIPSTGGVRRTLSVEPTEDGAEVVLTTSAKIDGQAAAAQAHETAEDLAEAAEANRLRDYMARKQAEQEDREAAKDQALSVVPFTRPSTNGHHKAKGGAR